jgi:hypothetical protein
VTRN